MRTATAWWLRGRAYIRWTIFPTGIWFSLFGVAATSGWLRLVAIAVLVVLLAVLVTTWYPREQEQ